MKKPVLIMGGGIGGLALAASLQRKGLACVVLEKRDTLAEGGSGLALWPNATGVLDGLGLLPEISARGSVLNTSLLRHWKGSVLKRVPVGDMAGHFGHPTITIARAELLKVLEQGLEDPSVLRFEAICQSIETKDDGVEVTLADGTLLEGSCLVGADGQRSFVREWMFPDAGLRYSGRTSWRGLIEDNDTASFLPEECMYEILGPGQRMGLLHAGPGRYYWYVQINAAKGAFLDAEHKPLLMSLTDGWAAPTQAVIEATPGSHIIHTELYHLPPLRQWHRGRVVLLGDAAHAMTPDLGQGACQALLDASILAQELAATDDPTLAFARYQACRRSGATQIQRASRTGGWVRQWNLAPLRWCRDLVIRLMPSQLFLRGLRRFISLP